MSSNGSHSSSEKRTGDMPPPDFFPDRKRSRIDNLDNLTADKGKGRAVHVQSHSEDGEEEEDGQDEEEDEDERFYEDGISDQQKQIMSIFDTDQTEHVSLDLRSITKQLKRFQSTSLRNRELRLKYPTDPQNFIESEAELDGCIHSLKSLAQEPQIFYPELLKGAYLQELVSLLSHENTDISIDVIELLEEITDDSESPEDLDSGDDHIAQIVQHLMKVDALELIISNFERLKAEKEEADQNGIFHIFGLLENLLAISPELGDSLVKNTKLVPFLLWRISPVPYDSNKQYASEILSILTQQSRNIRLAVIGREGQGLETILEVISQFRKKEPKDAEELEFIENIFNVLCSCLAEDEVKARFLQAEGMELMTIIMASKLSSRLRAIKVIDHAVSGSKSGAPNSLKLIEAGGLKHVFTAFMGKFNTKSSTSTDSVSSSVIEEHLLGILISLFTNLPSESNERIRLLAKFVENSYEKIDRLFELRDSANTRLRAVEFDIRNEMAGLEYGDGDEITAEEEEDFYMRRLEGGLFSLQMIDLIMAWLVMEDDGMKAHAQKLLSRLDLTFEHVCQVLREYAKNMGEEEAIPDSAMTQREITQNLIEYLQGS